MYSRPDSHWHVCGVTGCKKPADQPHCAQVLNICMWVQAVAFPGQGDQKLFLVDSMVGLCSMPGAPRCYTVIQIIATKIENEQLRGISVSQTQVPPPPLLPSPRLA